MLPLLDPLHAINRDLVGFWPLTEGAGQTVRDLSPWRNDGRGVNAPTWNHGRHGKAAAFSGPNSSSTQNYNVGARAVLGELQLPLTITAWIYPTSSSGFQPILAQYGAFTAGQLIKMLRTDSGTLKYYCTSGSGTFQAVGTLVPTLNVWSFVSVAVWGTIAAPSIRIRLNATTESPTLAALRSTITSTITTRIASNENTMSHSGNEGFNGRLQNVRIWRRALSPREEGALRADPWLGVLRAPRRVWYLPAGGTPHTAEPGAATLTWAGQSVTVQAAAALAPGAAALTWAGQVATVQAAAALAPGPAALTWSGQAVTVQAAANLAPGAAALAWQGLQASFGAGVEITVGAAALVWTGQAAVVSAAAVLSPGAATLAWFGQTVTVQAASISAPPARRTYRLGAAARRAVLAQQLRAYVLAAASRTTRLPEDDET